MLSLVLAIGCAGTPKVKGIPHCLTLDEWRSAREVALQHIVIDGTGAYAAFLDRYDYLDGHCIGTNEARGDE